MFTVTARLTVDPARIDDYEALAAELWAASHRFEPRLLRYEYVRGVGVGEYTTFMAFEDHEAFLFHQATDHHIEIAGRMRPMMTSVQIEYGVAVAGAFGHPETGAGLGADVGAGAARVGEGDVDAAEVPTERIEYYRDRYPPPAPDWWT